MKRTPERPVPTQEAVTKAKEFDPESLNRGLEEIARTFDARDGIEDATSIYFVDDHVTISAEGIDPESKRMQTLADAVRSFLIQEGLQMIDREVRLIDTNLIEVEGKAIEVKDYAVYFRVVPTE